MEDDLKRCRRIKWLMFQQDLFFTSRLGGKPRRATLQGCEVKGNIYVVADIGENFVLADTCGHGGQLSPVDSDPVKIQVPRPIIDLLKPGDELKLNIRKVADSDYWVVISSRGMQPGATKIQEHQPRSYPKPAEMPTVQRLDSEIDKFIALTKSADTKGHGGSNIAAHVNSPPMFQSTSRQANLARIRSDKEYQKRREEHLHNDGLPDDGIPDSIFNSTWSGIRVNDHTYDEDGCEMWHDEGGEDETYGYADFGDENDAGD